MAKDIIDNLYALADEKSIDAEVLLTALEDALLAAYKKTGGAASHAKVEIDRETGDVAVVAITLSDEALVGHPGVSYPEPEEPSEDDQPHESMVSPNAPPPVPVEPAPPEPVIDWSQFSAAETETTEMALGDFGRIAAQTAKQVILQRVREAERELMLEEYQDRMGDVVTGIVQQSDNRYTLVDLGRVEALLPGSEQVPGERYEHGARIKALITDVRTGTKGPQIVLSRRADDLIRKLFEMEVPEIESGDVEIRAVAREPGYRSKIAVQSHVQGVDPVGACVGPRGSRVRMVVSELRGEKIDIIPWNDEPARFVAKALQPARVREVLVDDESQQATVIVPDGELSLAIGREGQNARLAARLTGWRIDIKSESEFAEEEAEAAFSGSEGDDEVGGRCAALLSSGKRCPNSALPGSRYCGIPAHRELAAAEAEEATA